MVIDLKDLESPLAVESKYMTPGCTLRSLLELANKTSAKTSGLEDPGTLRFGFTEHKFQAQ